MNVKGLTSVKEFMQQRYNKRKELLMSNTCTNCADAQAKAQKLDEIVAKYKDTRGALIPVLHEAQEVYGYLPLEVQRVIAEKLNIPLAEVYGVVSFYTQFSIYPKGQYQINVCMGTACYVKGANEVLDKFRTRLTVRVWVKAVKRLVLPVPPAPFLVLIHLICCYIEKGLNTWIQSHAFAYINCAHNISFIGVHRIFVGISHNGLGCQMNHYLGLYRIKNLLHTIQVSYITYY